MALVAEVTEDGERRIAAVGRLSRTPGRPVAEFAILVADRWQRRGLGAELLRRLVRIGEDEGLELIWAETAREQHRHAPHGLCGRLLHHR